MKLQVLLGMLGMWSGVLLIQKCQKSFGYLDKGGMVN